MFGEEGLRKISSDPLLLPYLSDPLFIEMIDDIADHPADIVKYENKPELQTALTIILPMMMSSVPLPVTPSGPPPPTVASAEEEKEAGNACFKNQDFGGALAHFNAAIAIDSNNIVYYSNKASVLNKMKRFEDAMEAALLAVEVGQRNNATNEQIAKAYVKLANAATGCGKERGAYTALTESLNYHDDESVRKAAESLKKKLHL